VLSDFSTFHDRTRSVVRAGSFFDASLLLSVTSNALPEYRFILYLSMPKPSLYENPSPIRWFASDNLRFL
jgi:hypothetical protein